MVSNVSDTQKFQPGDKVRVTKSFETTVRETGWYHGKSLVAQGKATVELIERKDGSDSAEPQSAATDSARLERIRQLVADYTVDDSELFEDEFVTGLKDALSPKYGRAVDDPSKDPVGTVRQEGIAPAVVKIGPDHWVPVWPDRRSNTVEVFSNDDMAGYRVFGAVPGTPAYDSWVQAQAAYEDGHASGVAAAMAKQAAEEWKPEGYPFPLGTKVRGFRPRTATWETGYLIAPRLADEPDRVMVGKTPDAKSGNYLRASDLKRVDPDPLKEEPW